MENNVLYELKREILERLYVAEFNAIYHDLLHRRYDRRDFLLRMSLASSAVVVFLCIRLFPGGVWPTISGAITLLSTAVVPHLKWNKLIPRIEASKLHWVGLKSEYQNLWSNSKISQDWGDALKELKKLRKKDSNIERGFGLIPKHDDLLKKAREDVIALHRKPDQ